MLSAKEQELFDALSPRADAEKIEIVTVEVVGSKKAPTIRVYIDTPEGVGFDELSGAQAWINEIMTSSILFPVLTPLKSLRRVSIVRFAPRLTSRLRSVALRLSKPIAPSMGVRLSPEPSIR